MNIQWKKVSTSFLVLALSLVTTVASAQQWSQNAQTTQTSGHMITSNQQGTIQCQVASIDTASNQTTGLSGLNVYFIQNGQIAHQTKTDGNGSFSLNGVQPGPYSFVAAGKSGFAAYGVSVGQSTGNQLNLLEAATVSPRVEGIQQVLNQYLPSQVTQQIMNAGTRGSATTAKKVRLVSGQLNGQLASVQSATQQVGGAIVNLVQNGQRVAEVQVDGNGFYSIPDVEPGLYDFIAVGHDGLAAFRIECLGPKSPLHQVSYTTKAPTLVPTSLDCCLTCQSGSAQPAMDYAVQAQPVYNSAPIEYAGQSMGTGGAAGGSCGCAGSYGGYTGGGGGGFGGRLGGLGGGGFAGGLGGGLGGGGSLLMLGGAAGAIVAIADDDDPDPQSPNN